MCYIMLTIDQNQAIKSRFDNLLLELKNRSSNLKLVKDENLSIKDKPLGTSLNIANEIILLLDPNAIIEKDVSKIVLNTIDFNNAKYEKWFQTNPRRTNKKTAIIHFEKSKLLESRFYWLSSNATKSIVSASVHLSPNWEDTIETKKAGNLKIGLDFFLKPNMSGILMVVSHLGNLRVLELSDHLSNTQVNILSSLSNILVDNEISKVHDKLWNALSISSVNNVFYSGVADQFDKLVTHISAYKSIDDSKLYSMRLIGRVLFIWFLRKKGFINENGTNYFDVDKYSNSADYYNSKLKELFFSTLNTEASSRMYDKVTPYLNGGLFEAHDNDWINEYLDFPENFFKEFYDHLNRFNFTTDESTPEYQQVAIDPEMLGRVFENLLATQLTESGDTSRKANGSFYTPREIVSFMCKESLATYLQSFCVTENQRKAVNLLVYATDFDFEKADTNFKRDILTLGGTDFDSLLLSKIENIKVIDPACGSGAFPMGMLQVLLTVTERLMGKKIDIYAYKLKILKNNIYGVDIESMAIEISRLRAWLSIIVDEKNASDVMPLPNLDFKFIAANSLLKLTSSNTLWTDEKLESQLSEIRDNYFTARSLNEKTHIRNEYKKLIQFNNNDLFDERTQQLKSFDPFRTRGHALFFDPEYIFGITNGFDVVIGNPPYLDSENMTKNNMTDLRDYLRNNYSFTKGNWDIYVAFFEMGFKSLSKNGVLTFITPNKWISKPFGEAMRIALIDHIVKIYSAGSDVFDTVIVDSIVTFVEKKKSSEIELFIRDENKIVHSKKVNKNVFSKNYQLDLLFSNHISLVEKMQSSSTRLSDIAECESACSTSDAYELSDLIKSLNNPGEFTDEYFKLINTGTIDKFFDKWDQKSIKYLKNSYDLPVINKHQFKSKFSNSYGKKASKMKIIIKGLTLLDACLDLKGVIIPGKSTLIIMSDDISKLYKLLGMINSKLFYAFVKESNSSSSYLGGITFTKEMINSFPIKMDFNSEYDEIGEISKKILNNMITITEGLDKINTIMYRIYSLTEDERMHVNEISKNQKYNI